MPGPFPGDPLRISAKEMQQLRELLRRTETARQGLAAPPVSDRPWHSSVIIRVRNKSGAPVVRGGVLRIGDPPITPDDNETEWRREVLFDGRTPRGGDALFVLTLQPLDVDEIGDAVLAGAAHTQLHIPDFTVPAHQFAIPIADRTDALQLDETRGVPVLYKSPRTGDEAFATVVLDPGRTLEGVVVRSDSTGSSYGGCDFTDCLPDDSPWMTEVDCGGCAKLPRWLRLNFPGVNNRGECGLYKKVALPSPFSTIEGYFEDWLLEMQTSDGYATGDGTCEYRSPVIPCTKKLTGKCGSVTYTWNAGYRTVNCAVTWRWVANACPQETCRHRWQWSDVSESWEYQAQEGDCVGGVTSPSPPTGHPGAGSYTRYTDCTPVVPFRWVADPRPSECGAPVGLCGDGGGGTLEPPASPPGSGDPTVVVRPCTITVEDPEASGWVQTGSCGCGTAPPPETDGTFHGETVVVLCGQPEEGDPVPANYQWRLSVNGNDSTLTLVENGVNVIWTYKPLPPRGWCCNCANTMVAITCGPFEGGYSPPGTACLIPVRVNFCPVADLGDELEIDVGGLTDADGSPYSEINGAWGLYPGSPVDFGLLTGGVVWFPNEAENQRTLWGYSIPNTMLACPLAPECEYHSAIKPFEYEGDDWLAGVALCAAVSTENGFELRVYLCLAKPGIVGNINGRYIGTNLDLFATEWTLTGESLSGSPLPPGAPATITVRRIAI